MRTGPRPPVHAPPPTGLAPPAPAPAGPARRGPTALRPGSPEALLAHHELDDHWAVAYALAPAERARARALVRRGAGRAGRRGPRPAADDLALVRRLRDAYATAGLAQMDAAEHQVARLRALGLRPALPAVAVGVRAPALAGSDDVVPYATALTVWHAVAEGGHPAVADAMAEALRACGDALTRVRAAAGVVFDAHRCLPAPPLATAAHLAHVLLGAAAGALAADAAALGAWAQGLRAAPAPEHPRPPAGAARARGALPDVLLAAGAAGADGAGDGGRPRPADLGDDPAPGRGWGAEVADALARVWLDVAPGALLLRLPDPRRAAPEPSGESTGDGPAGDGAAVDRAWERLGRVRERRARRELAAYADAAPEHAVALRAALQGLYHLADAAGLLVVWLRHGQPLQGVPEAVQALDAALLLLSPDAALAEACRWLRTACRARLLLAGLPGPAGTFRGER